MIGDQVSCRKYQKLCETFKLYLARRLTYEALTYYKELIDMEFNGKDRGVGVIKAHLTLTLYRSSLNGSVSGRQSFDDPVSTFNVPGSQGLDKSDSGK
jgi:hypothetical protein